jgi:hypothetical protein
VNTGLDSEGTSERETVSFLTKRVDEKGEKSRED